MPPTPSLSVLIVNYASWPDTARLTRRLLRSPCVRRGDAEVVIVDNHSPPHPLLARVRRWPGVSLRRWGRNRGFGRAANEAARLSRGRWLLLLNPDVTVPDGFLDDVFRVAERASERDGVIGFRLLNADGTLQPSVGRFPTFGGTLAGLLRPRRRRKYLRRQPRRPREVDWLSGCCLLVREECFSRLGGFDPKFFLYYEDVDLCRRARAQGWAVRFDPAVAVVHRRPLQDRAVPPHVRMFTRHSLLTYAGKHWSTWQPRALAVLIWAEAVLRRFLARWRGERRAARVFAVMAEVAADLGRGRTEDARRRLDRVARQEERRLATRAVRRRAEPQPPRPAPGVPEERHPVRAAEHPDPGG